MSELVAYTIEQAAQRLTVCPRTLRRMEERGEIRFGRIGKRVVVPASEIMRLLTPARPVEALPQARTRKVRLIARAG